LSDGGTVWPQYRPDACAMQPAISAADVANASAAPIRDIKEAFIFQYLMICPKKMSLLYGQW
jgi:hypothetical protein